jgi:hypothetical protein
VCDATQRASGLGKEKGLPRRGGSGGPPPGSPFSFLRTGATFGFTLLEVLVAQSDFGFSVRLRIAVNLRGASLGGGIVLGFGRFSIKPLYGSDSQWASRHLVSREGQVMSWRASGQVLQSSRFKE